MASLYMSHPTKKKETSLWCWNNKNNEGRRPGGGAAHPCSTTLFAIIVLWVNTIFWISHSSMVADPNYDEANRMMLTILGNPPSTTAASAHLTRQSTDPAVVGFLNQNVIRSHLLSAERVHAAQQQDKSKPRLPAEALQDAPPVLFLSKEDGLTEHDMFSASWWQPVERFLEFPVHKIGIVEDDTFKPLNLAGRGRSDGRMTRDWLDFAIEHLR